LPLPTRFSQSLPNPLAIGRIDKAGKKVLKTLFFGSKCSFHLSDGLLSLILPVEFSQAAREDAMRGRPLWSLGCRVARALDRLLSLIAKEVREREVLQPYEGLWIVWAETQTSLERVDGLGRAAGEEARHAEKEVT
jgi:hypothetical protein